MTQEAEQTSASRAKRGSIIVVAVLLAVAAAIALAVNFFQPASNTSLMVKVTIYGEVVDLFPLDTNLRQTYVTDDGKNTVVIQDGKVHIEDADCAGGDCMRQGEIGQTGRLLVCLPHQLIVEIVSPDGSSAPSQYTGNEAVGDGTIDAVTH